MAWRHGTPVSIPRIKTENKFDLISSAKIRLNFAQIFLLVTWGYYNTPSPVQTCLGSLVTALHYNRSSYHLVHLQVISDSMLLTVFSLCTFGFDTLSSLITSLTTQIHSLWPEKRQRRRREPCQLVNRKMGIREIINGWGKHGVNLQLLARDA